MKSRFSLSKEELGFWWDTIRTHEEAYASKHKLWLSLLKIYDLDIEVPGARKGETIKISEFYPVLRQIIAGVAFNYPKIYVKADESLVEGAGPILEQVIQDTIEIQEAKHAVRYCLFAACFCSIGWLDVFYNPPDDEFTTNDPMKEDFPNVDAENPFHVMVDLLTKPHRFGSHRFTIRKRMIPGDEFRNDPRYANKKGVKPFIAEREDILGFELDIAGGVSEFDEIDHVLDTFRQGKYVLVWEISDRRNQRVISLVEGKRDEAAAVEYHPMARVEAVERQNPMTGKSHVVGFKRAPGYLNRHGSSLIPVRFDQHLTSLYPKPPLFYLRDPQKLIMESMTRRHSLLKRFPRIVLAQRREIDMDSTLERRLKEAEDGTVVGVQDPDRWKPVPWGDPPRDQLGLESDARQYSARTIGIDNSALSSASTPATNRALDQVPVTLNRELMKDTAVTAYRDIADTNLAMFGDPRYFPDEFWATVSDEEKKLKGIRLTQDYFRVRHQLTIHADSLEPLVEQQQKNDVVMWFDRAYSLPETNRVELLTRFHKAFRQPNPEKLLALSPDADAIKASQVETVGFIMRGLDPGVRPGEKHQIHLQQHSQLEQFPDFAQLDPRGQQLARQANAQHMAAHQQMMQQEAGGPGSARPGGSQPKVDGKALGADRFIETVQGNAQRVAQLVTDEPAEGIPVGGGA